MKKYEFIQIVDLHPHNGYYREKLSDIWINKEPKTAKDILELDILDSTKFLFIEMVELTTLKN